MEVERKGMADDQTVVTGDADNPAPAAFKPPRDYEMDGETPPAKPAAQPDPAQTPDPEPAPAEPPEGDDPDDDFDDEGDDDNAGTDNRSDPNHRQGRGGFRKKLARSQAEIERLTAENARLAAQAGQPKPPANQPQNPPKNEPPEPKLEDFASWDAFNDAKVQWLADKRISEALAKAERERRETELRGQIAKKVETFQQTETEAAKKYPDYHKVVRKEGTHPMLAQLVLESPYGAELAYRVKSNPGYDTVNQASVVEMARFVGKIEAQIEAENSKGSNDNAARKVTNAPPPMKPVGTGTGSASRFDPETSDDLEAWKADQKRRKAATR